MGTKSLTFLSLFCLIFHFSSAFVPQDNYLLNCGSSNSTTLIVDNRNFIGDSVYLSKGKSISLTNPNPFPNSSLLYSTARVFPSSSSYTFKIKNFGTHLVRLHFSPFISHNYDLNIAKFGVLANGFSLFSSFGTKVSIFKEFFMMVDKLELEIVFMPYNFAYVNAIEVFSVSKDFFIDAGGIPLITPTGLQDFKQNVSYEILETVHRINVGGSKLTPFNDTLWRTWIPDQDFLVFKSAAKIATSPGPLNYMRGGATKESAPDNVYLSAQQMNIANGSFNFLFNITWDFPVEAEDSMHLVRLHFCDIVSKALNTLYFNVYLNEVLAYKDIDLSVLAVYRLASPYYIDFVVKNAKDLGFIRVSLGPSDLSNAFRKNAILNGVEIMKMVGYVDSRKRSSMKKDWILVGLVLVGVLALILVFFAVRAILKRLNRKRKPSLAKSGGGSTLSRVHGGARSQGAGLDSPGPYGYYGLQIPLSDVKSATNDFDKNLIIGIGGFGTVYKGVLKENIKVAVKRGTPGSRQGLPEFQTEITFLSKIRHHHLVSLVGYSEEQNEMILVYEYVEKGPLRRHLYGSNLPPLSWKLRLEICIGAARGLHYLHTGSAHGIIHRDIKSTNILLDENYIAKVADFGLSKSGPCLDETHVSTAIKGSFGYLDPEYFRRQQLTDKSDVYSFGVVLFEVLCARPAIDPLRTGDLINLAEWAMEWHKKGQIDQIIDSELVGQIIPSSLKIFAETAEKCLGEYGVDRPTMGDVLWNLENAYQVQVSESQRGTQGLSNAAPAPELGVTGDREEDDDSDISTSRVFSQLITKEGR